MLASAPAPSPAAALLALLRVAVFVVFPLGGLSFGAQNSLTVRYRYLIIIGMDFAERQEAMAVSAILDKSGLKRWLYPRDTGEVDISAKLFLVLGFEIEFFNAVAACHDDTCFLRVGGVYQHLVGHYSVSSRRAGRSRYWRE